MDVFQSNRKPLQRINCPTERILWRKIEKQRQAI